MRRLIAEIGSCNGDLSLALDTVDAFADVGVWAIKGQLFTAETITTRQAATYSLGLPEPETQWEAFSNALTYEQWGDVAARCYERGLEFFGSVFDLTAVDVAVEQGWEYIKLASGDITYQRLYEKVATHDWHVFWSTGASYLWEVQRAATWLGDIPNTPMACTLAYPCPVEHAHVDRMRSLSEFLATASFGYSDHTVGIAAADYAFRSGAAVVEKHVTIVPGTGGDHDFAAPPAFIKQLLQKPVNLTDTDLLVAGSDIVQCHDIELQARYGARRSLVATVRIGPGESITSANTVALRPFDGVPPIYDKGNLVASGVFMPGETITHDRVFLTSVQ